MTSCVDGDGDPGLMCGEQCQWVGYWCSDDYYSVTCTTFTLDNRDLCQNRTFWEDISCGTHPQYESEGFRCNGTNMRCVYPVSGYGDTCDDHSDATIPQNTTCSPELGKAKQKLCKESCDIK